MSPLAPPRLGVVWFPSWPLVAAGKDPSSVAAVVKANRVMEVSSAAQERGVVAGMRRRESQSRCPDLDLVEHDPNRDARWFETVVSAFEAVAPRVEVSRPGVLSFAVRGPARYLGGETAMAKRSCEVADAALKEVLSKLGIETELPKSAMARIGVSEGHFAATLAARLQVMPADIPAKGVLGRLLIDQDKAREFLAPLPLDTLVSSHQSQDNLATWDRLVDLLGRLGVHSLGEFARFGAAEVSGRLGPEGILAHRLAQGLDPKPLSTRAIPDDLMCELYLDPPVLEVSAAAFLARGLAAELHDKLARRGIACTSVAVEARTEHGEEMVRVWSHSGALSADDVADRMRWQLEGWLASSNGPTAPLELLRLSPQTVVPDGGSQLDLWGEQARPSEEIVRAVTRLQGLLGPQAVLVPELCGGRGPAEQINWVIAKPNSLTGIETPERDQAPWPGRLSSPSPSLVPAVHTEAQLCDGDGREVLIDARGALSGEPASVDTCGETEEIVAWAGPWPAHERWWVTNRGSRRARIQVLTAGGRAYLFSREKQQWWLEGIYD